MNEDELHQSRWQATHEKHERRPTKMNFTRMDAETDDGLSKKELYLCWA